VYQDGAPVARIQVTALPDRSQLKKAGDNLFMFTGAAQISRHPANARLLQGYVESSAVDPILALNEMINMTKAVQANARMLQFHDHLMDQAVNTLGRVA
jgi:flagellar basal-body rod protein FlgG